MVYLQELHERFPQLLVYVISMHPDPEVARQETRDMGITYPVFNGLGSELGERYAYG